MARKEKQQFWVGFCTVLEKKEKERKRCTLWCSCSSENATSMTDMNRLRTTNVMKMMQEPMTNAPRTGLYCKTWEKKNNKRLQSYQYWGTCLWCSHVLLHSWRSPVASLRWSWQHVEECGRNKASSHTLNYTVGGWTRWETRIELMVFIAKSLYAMFLSCTANMGIHCLCDACLGKC